MNDAARSKASPNLIDIQKDYQIRAFEDIEGLKILVQDERTTSSICLLFSKSELWNYNVFQIEQITNMSDNKDSKKLKTLLVIQPTQNNIKQIEKNLSKQTQTSTYIFFINYTEDCYIRELAIKDIKTKKIKMIREIYSDYLVLNRKIFALSSYIGSQLLRLKGANLKESIHATLYSQMMSLRVVPKVYYSRSITFGHEFGKELSEFILNEKIEYPKDFNNEETALLIFDREDDLFTPLLLPNTYQVYITRNKQLGTYS